VLAVAGAVGGLVSVATLIFTGIQASAAARSARSAQASADAADRQASAAERQATAAEHANEIVSETVQVATDPWGRAVLWHGRGIGGRVRIANESKRPVVVLGVRSDLSDQVPNLDESGAARLHQLFRPLQTFPREVGPGDSIEVSITQVSASLQTPSGRVPLVQSPVVQWHFVDAADDVHETRRQAP